jgi:hypothetical protein
MYGQMTNLIEVALDTSDAIFASARALRCSTNPQGLAPHRLPITLSPNARMPVPDRCYHDRVAGHMTGLATHEFAAFIGLDWADAQQAICLQVADCDQRECTVLDHQPEVIDAWVTALLQRFQGQPIAIALELHKGPIVEALRKYAGLVLLHINPMMLAKYRQAFTPSRAKDDPTDAELQLELLLRHRDKLKPLAPQSAEMRWTWPHDRFMWPSPGVVVYV